MRADARVEARFGLAAVAEEAGQFDDARGHYQAVLDDPAATALQQAVVERQLSVLDAIADAPPLLDPAPRPAATRPATQPATPLPEF